MIQTPKGTTSITRRAPTLWREVFQSTVKRKSNAYAPFKLDEIAYLVRRDKAISITHKSLRVKLARYAAKGYLRKEGRTEYTITSRGHMFFDIPKDKEEERMNIK